MAGHNVSRANFTPSATQNLVLDAQAAGNYGKVTKVTWGGELSASQNARTRWTRPTALGASTFTTLSPEAGNVQNTPRCRAGTFATIPTIAAAPQGLFGISWNKNGGGGIYSATQPDEEWDVIFGVTPGQQIACVQDVDVQGNSMSTSLHWKEA
jgi:hypothetical protein